MKRYCIFSAQYLPHMGGVERYTYYIAKKLVERGDKVTVVASSMEGEALHEVQEGIEIYRLPVWWFVDGRFPVIKPTSILGRIRRNLSKRNFDLVIVNARFYPHSLYGQRFAKKNRIKCITIEHGTSHLTFNHPVWDVLEHIYEHAISFLGSLYCENYYGVSQACCEWSRHFKIAPKGVLYNAVDAQELEGYLANPVHDYRKEYGLNEDDFVVTFTGRLIKEKGIEQLIEAVKRLKLDKRVILFIAGSGPLEDTIKNACRNVPGDNPAYYVGQLDYQHVAALLGITDVFCLPSDSEGFPTSVLEAVAAKCFVITTSTGGAKELIRGHEYGMIINDNYIKTIADAIEKAFVSEHYRMSAVNQAYNLLKNEFTFDKTVEKIQAITEGKA